IATDPFAAELGRDPGTFTIQRQGATAQNLTVHFSIGGTANAGSDYDPPPRADFIVIRAGEALATLTIAPTDDQTVEGLETVILTLLASPDYALGVQQTATITIADHPTVPVVSIVATDAGAAELGSDPGEFTITRSGDLSKALVVPVAISGTATIGRDYA